MIKGREKGEGATEQHTDLTPIRVNARLAVPLLLLLFAAFAVSSNAASNTILTVTGLPSGANFIYRIAPNYTTVSYTSTGYTTKIPIYISASTNSTYHGAVPWQYQGAGTTVAYNGVTYTMLTGTQGTCSTQILSTNGLNNFCSFYVYLNSSLWNSDEKAELQQVNSSLASAKLVVASLTNTSTSLPYNGIAPAGNTIKYTTYNNGSVNFVSANIVKATPPLTITIDGQVIQGAGVHQLPIAIINGHAGLTGKTYYWLNVTLNSALLAGNKNAYSYSIKLTNGTTLVPNTLITAQNITQTYSYKINEYVGANVTLDAGGNLNYTALDPSGITLPSNVVIWVNITIQNTKAITIPANTPIPITFNAGNFQAYEAANMMNVECFNTTSGLVLNCWLEGNVLNEGQTANLYTSNNLLYWLKLPWRIGSSATVTNGIAFGFGGTANDFYNGGTTGTAPQLSTPYGAVDNGKNVFFTYLNFTGTSTPSGWTLTGTGLSINNGIRNLVHVATEAQGQFYKAGTNASQTLDVLTAQSSGSSGRGLAREGSFNTGTYNNGVGAVFDGFTGTPNLGYWGGGFYSAQPLPTSNTLNVESIIGSSGNLNGSINYGLSSTLEPGFAGDIGYNQEGGGIAGNPVTSYWLRLRASLPNNVSPTITLSGSGGGGASSYSASGTTKTNPIITGSAEEWFLNFSNPYAGGTITNAVLILGNQTLTLGTVLANKYYYNLNSFVPSRFGIANPTGINSISVPYMMNAIVTFNGNTVLRNATGSFTVNAPALLTCAAYTANAFAWNFYNATSLLPIAENVLMSGYFTIKNGLLIRYDTGNLSWLFVGGNIQHLPDLTFPPWSTFGTYGTLQYAANNYSGSQFLMVNQSTSNVVKPINLYLQQIDNPSAYDIVVERGINNPISAYVQELLYNINLNESVLVNEFQTPVGGGYVVNLQTNSYYQFKVFNSNGQLLNTTSYLQASCASGSVCTY